MTVAAEWLGDAAWLGDADAAGQSTGDGDPPDTTEPQPTAVTSRNAMATFDRWDILVTPSLRPRSYYRSDAGPQP